MQSQEVPAAEIDLNAVEPKLRECIRILTVVAAAAFVTSATSPKAHVGVSAHAESLCVETVRQPFQPARPQLAIDDKVAGRVAGTIPPTDIDPDPGITMPLKTRRAQPRRLFEDDLLINVRANAVVAVPAHIGRLRHR